MCDLNSSIYHNCDNNTFENMKILFHENFGKFISNILNFIDGVRRKRTSTVTTVPLLNTGKRNEYILI